MYNNINIKSFIGNRFKQNLRTNAALQLIVINIGIFILLKLVNVIVMLFNLGDFDLWQRNFLYISAAWQVALRRSWTFFTYMFMHADMLHLLINMCCLWWFGNFALKRFSATQFRWIYFIGGFAGALFYILAYNILPYFEYKIADSRLLGASGAVMAIIVASAVADPNYRVRILLAGGVKIKWIAIITVIICITSLSRNNVGGEFCHIGGAIGGLIMSYLMVNGSNLFSPIKSLFSRSHSKIRPQVIVEQEETKYHYVKSRINDSEPTNTTSQHEESSNEDSELDAILNKIQQSGYSSLSNEEKQRLFGSNK